MNLAVLLLRVLCIAKISVFKHHGQVFDFTFSHRFIFQSGVGSTGSEYRLISDALVS